MKKLTLIGLVVVLSNCANLPPPGPRYGIVTLIAVEKRGGQVHYYPGPDDTVEWLQREITRVGTCEAWEATRKEIASYDEIVTVPQFGLVPIGGGANVSGITGYRQVPQRRHFMKIDYECKDESPAAASQPKSKYRLFK